MPIWYQSALPSVVRLNGPLLVSALMSMHAPPVPPPPPVDEVAFPVSGIVTVGCVGSLVVITRLPCRALPAANGAKATVSCTGVFPTVTGNAGGLTKL